MTLTITEADMAELHAHARDTYPDECCGMLVERNGVEEVVRVTNMQDELHAKDPAQYPRTARIAYTMGREAFPILEAAERGQLSLRAFYHSHPDHDAYFSAEDRKQACAGWDEPVYAAAWQIVMSVRDGAVAVTKAFAWDASRRDYVEVPLTVRNET
jgi:[CysO sulfur-carrier protein]-S-L-cysteine hydrolase